MSDAPDHAELLRDALRELRALKAERSQTHGAVAVVGVGLHLPPDIHTLDALWTRLERGAPVWRRPSAARAEHPAFDDLVGWLDGVGDFDAERFGISPDAARLIDPQGRLLLEACETALAHAGLDHPHDVGVFVGTSVDDWSQRTLHGGHAEHPRAGLGTWRSTLATRIAHALDLHGPALTVDTSCASGLTAVHLAVQALRRGDCTLALAGAAATVLDPDLHVHLRAAGLLASDGMRPLAEDGDGYTRGEGVVVLCLALADEAAAAGWPVLATVRGTATGVAGRTLALGTASTTMHARTARAALRDAGMAAGEVALLEVHGTGLDASDRLELTGLAEVYGDGEAPLPVGTAKAVFGHLEAAGGLLGLLVGLLAAARGQVPPFVVQGVPTTALGEGFALREAGPLPQGASVGVHAYGMSGHVAHAVVGPPPDGARPPAGEPPAYARATHWLPLPHALPARPSPLRTADPSAAVHAIVADVLGDVGPLDPDLPLAWQGIDSVAVAAILARLHSDLGVPAAQLDRDVVWDLRTLEQVAVGTDVAPAGPGWPAVLLAVVVLTVIVALVALGFLVPI